MSDMTGREQVAGKQLAEWAVGNLTKLIRDAMPSKGRERDVERQQMLNHMRSQAHSALFIHDDVRQCLLSFFSVATLHPMVHDFQDVALPGVAKPFVTAVVSGRVTRSEIWQTLGEAIQPEKPLWEDESWLLDDEPAMPKVAGHYPAWIVPSDTHAYSGLKPSRVLPTLWEIAREQKWTTTDAGSHFHVPAKLTWHKHLNRWSSPAHQAFFAALSWAWEQVETGKRPSGASRGPGFMLSFKVVPHGHDRVWAKHKQVFVGRDRRHGRVFVDWFTGRALVHSPEHLVALVADVMDAEESELTLAVLPSRLYLSFGSRGASWPWANIGHRDLQIFGQDSCTICLGLGYTIDAEKCAEQRVVRPCPDCCDHLLENCCEDSATVFWPRADDTAFEQYLRLRQQRYAAQVGKTKGKRGRKANDIKMTIKFVPISAAEAERRWNTLQRIIKDVEARRREAEQVQEVVRENPRPKLIVDTTALIADFLQFAALAGTVLTQTDIKVEELLRPHQRPKSLPQGKQAVYVFCTDWDCLKVGQVGPNSAARYTSQHYSLRAANSTLSRSLLRCDAVQKATLLSGVLPEPTEEGIGSWVEQHTSRYNFLISKDQPTAVLSLLETFLQNRLKPMFG